MGLLRHGLFTSMVIFTFSCEGSKVSFTVIKERSHVLTNHRSSGFCIVFNAPNPPHTPSPSWDICDHLISNVLFFESQYNGPSLKLSKGVSVSVRILLKEERSEEPNALSVALCIFKS